MKYSSAFIIIFSFTALISNAQNLQSLDQQNGFGSFSFGDDVNDYKDDLKLDLTISLGQKEIKYYGYQGKELKTVYALTSNQVNLGFENGKLFYLDIYFKKLGDGEFQELLKQFEQAYGTSTEIEPMDQGAVEAYNWIGSIVEMQVVRYDQSAAEEERNMTVVTFNKKE
ncbi:MAG: hypothetical protein AAFX87_19830 [Bacteroidota bacterium]